MTMSEEIIKVLDALGSKFGIAIDWTAENIMPYAQELFDRFIDFEIVTSIFYMVLWPLIAIVFLVAARCTYPHAKKVEYDEGCISSWVFVLGMLLSVVSTIVSLVVIPVQVFEVITCNILPEKLILNYLMQLR